MRFSARVATLVAFATFAIGPPPPMPVTSLTLPLTAPAPPSRPTAPTFSISPTTSSTNRAHTPPSLAKRQRLTPLRPPIRRDPFFRKRHRHQRTLTIPSTGFTKTFTGANPSDLQSQIHDFLKHDGQNA